MSQIRRWSNWPSPEKHDELEYLDVAENVFHLSDLLNFFQCYKNTLLGPIEEDKIPPGASACLSDEHCSPERLCFGCILMARLKMHFPFRSPLDDEIGGSFLLIRDKCTTHQFLYQTCQPDPAWSQYGHRELGWSGGQRYTLAKQSHPNQHIIMIDAVMTSICPHLNYIKFFYFCRDECLKLIQSPNYGRASLETLGKCPFHSKIEDEVTYLLPDVVEAIVMQIHYNLYLLSVNEYTHGRPGIEYLAWTDQVFDNGTVSYPITVHILPSEDDTIVWRGHKLIRSVPPVPPTEKSFKNKREMIIHARNHEGISFDFCRFEFNAFLNDLLQDPLFNRSLKRCPELNRICRLKSSEIWETLREGLRNSRSIGS